MYYKISCLACKLHLPSIEGRGGGGGGKEINSHSNTVVSKRNFNEHEKFHHIVKPHASTMEINY